MTDLNKVHGHDIIVSSHVLHEIERERERSASDPMLARALALAAAVMPVAAAAGEILLDGQSNLVAEAADLERARCVLRTLEEKDQIVKLLDRTLAAPGICVFIGAEANLADLSDISVVAASYGPAPAFMLNWTNARLAPSA